LFVDFKNAFDAVRKDKLLKKMKEGGYDPRLIQAIQFILMDTQIIVDDKVIKT
jgi:hypothetical protein